MIDANGMSRYGWAQSWGRLAVRHDVKRRRILLLIVSALLLVVAIAWLWPSPPPVTISFVGSTKEYGGHSLGHFRLTNHTRNKSFVCLEGPTQAQIHGRWIE